MGQATAICQGRLKLFFNYGAKQTGDPVLPMGFLHNLEEDPQPTTLPRNIPESQDAV